MRRLRALVGLLLVAGAASGPGQAATPGLAATVVQASVLSADSIHVKVLAYLARGDIAGAIAMYEVHTGRVAPAWLMDLQVAYGVANQAAGNCQQVARFIHTAFIKLGQTPQYIAFRTNTGRDYMVFELANGKSAPVSRTGYHVAVRVGDMIHDAYTGPLGMKLSDYLSRLHAREGVTWEAVLTP
ncbi:papain fold toxin domain-containing protein [Archangium gephyra]|uniref:papain fold toxin domain-containing protein n=1 Tax=Archangium gephyra TaxID=48 RepID=UPI003B80A38A